MVCRSFIGLCVTLVVMAGCGSSESDPPRSAAGGVAGSAGRGVVAAGKTGAGNAGAPLGGGTGGQGRGGSDAGRGAGGSPASSGGRGAGRAGAGDGGSEAGSAGEGGSSGGPVSIVLPPPNAGLDYQLGGAYEPPAGVGVVSRDRNDPIAPGLYNICYVNGFQIQQSEESFWLGEHPDLILRDEKGDPVVDPDWDEMLIDVSTPAQRDAVAAIVGDWIRGCADDGFDAVEIDNLDSFSRSDGRLTESNAVTMMAQFAEAAHAVGLAIAQKNSAELVGSRSELGTDFAVAEECNRWAECDAYVGAYGDLVLVIEYRESDFAQGCADYPSLSIVLRDLDLVTPSSGAYVFDGC